MKVFLAALFLVGLCMVGLCFNIIFRKGGQFPQTEIEKNDEMKKLGIKCAKQEEMERWRKEHGGAAKCDSKSREDGCGSCEGCAFNK